MRLDSVVDLMLVETPAWMLEAACQGEPLETFFAPKGSNYRQVTARAKAICFSCPVRDECYTYAMNWSPRDLPGIWAGLTEKERGIIQSCGLPPRYSSHNMENV